MDKVLGNDRVGLTIQIVGGLFFIFYAVLSIQFFQERMLSFESAAMAFELVHTKSFVITLDRWGCVFSQILPLTVLKAGASLTTILKAYSLSFVLLNYVGFLIVTVLFKNYRAAIIYLLVLCLVNRNTFYFTGAIYSQGLPLVVILYTMVTYAIQPQSKNRKLALLGSLGLIVMLYFFHQLLVIAIVFVLLFVMISNNRFKDKQLIGLLIATILWFGIKLLLLPGDSYAHARIPGLGVFKNEIPHFFSLPSFAYFAAFFKIEMIIISTLSLGCVVFLFYQRKYLIALLCVGFSLAYLVLITITYYKGQAPFMYERYYILFGLFMAFLIDAAWAKRINIQYLFVFIIPLLVYSSQRVYAAHEQPSKRIAYITKLAEEGKKLENRKYIIHQDDIPWDYTWAVWGMPAELLLVSSIDDPQNSVTIYVHSKHETVDYSANDGMLLSIDWMRPILDAKKFDPQFFNIPIYTDYLVTNRLSSKYEKQQMPR